MTQSNTRALRFLSMLPGNPVPVPEGANATNAVLSLSMGADAPSFEIQVKTYLEGLGNAGRGVTGLVPVGQAVAAILTTGGLEMLGGLPSALAIVNIATRTTSWFDANEYRHTTVRVRRSERPEGDAFPGFTVLDGRGTGLTPEQLTELASKLGTRETNIRVVGVQAGKGGQVDLSSGEAATAGMADQLIATGLTIGDWMSGRVIFLPGGLGIVGLLQAITIHGLSEAWPQTIRLAGTPATGFHVAEVVNPQAMRQWATELAARLDAMKPTMVLSGNIADDVRARFAQLATELGVNFRG